MRAAWTAGLVLLVAGLATREAPAQVLSGPSLPLGLDPHKAPVGAWADYRLSTGGGGPEMVQRFALVARGASSDTLELGVDLPFGRLTMQLTLDADPKVKQLVKKAVMQLGDEEPMSLPPGSPEASQLERPDPSKLGPAETIQVTAGRFKARKREEVRADGRVEAWLSEEVPPLGLVKLVARGRDGSMVYAVELVERGAGAKPTVRGVAKPYSEDALTRQLSGTSARSSTGKADDGKPAKKPRK